MCKPRRNEREKTMRRRFTFHSSFLVVVLDSQRHAEKFRSFNNSLRLCNDTVKWKEKFQVEISSIAAVGMTCQNRALHMEWKNEPFWIIISTWSYWKSMEIQKFILTSAKVQLLNSAEIESTTVDDAEEKYRKWRKINCGFKKSISTNHSHKSRFSFSNQKAANKSCSTENSHFSRAPIYIHTTSVEYRSSLNST